ncbi:MAG: MarR family transcriptional regulator [Pseudomonadota bacterium]|nr:MarR family transcriptional regulator [Pseudomonadota bacterium]
MIEPKDIMEFANRFGLASQLFQSVLERRLGPMGLTPPQLSVLSHLARKGSPLRITDIANDVQVGQPAVTKMVAKFAANGWVVMQSKVSDRRSKVAQITEAGGQHLVDVQRALLPEIGPYLMGWDREDLEGFTKNLMQFARFLDQLGDLDDPSEKGISNKKT